MTKHTSAAIIGMGCFFPKSSGRKQFWRLIFKGEDAVTDVPPTHWSSEDYYDENPDAPDRVYCTRGGFLPPVSFDPTEFGIPPASLEATDTSQLLGLIAAKSALEHAGYSEKREFDRSRVSVILGATGTQELVIPLGARLGHPKWRKALKECGVPDDKAEEVIRKISDSYVPWQENSFPGLLGNVIAGRICNRLDLGGTNCAVDAACASSMSAVHLALMELSTKKSDIVVTGGVDALNDIFMHMCFSKTRILSPTGDARPFSKEADGTVLGEGVGMIVLKRLADAQSDGDEIYAVIKGIGSSSDGRSQSIYAPRAEGQRKALEEAYENADVDPATVELIEAHGTGTRVGDRVEFESLSKVFANAPEKRCALGSVKSNIGHAKAAAGSAGLIKAALALHHKVLPPTLKVDEPDPGLNIEKGPFYLNPQSRPWIKNDGSPRRAGVSAFGFGGSNFHLVMEEYGSGKKGPSWTGAVEIFSFSARRFEEIERKLADLSNFSDAAPSAPEISREAAKSRESFDNGAPHRFLFTYETDKDFSQRVREARTALVEKPRDRFWTHRGAYFGGPSDHGKLAFAFPGQGSQYMNMGRDIVCLFPEALESVEGADTLCRELDGKLSLADAIYPRLQGAAESTEIYENNLRSTDVAQPAIGAVSIGMANVMKRFGVAPDCVCGHSFGELAALCCAGRISEEDFHKLGYWRGRLMADASGSGGAMTAVKAPLDELEKMLDQAGSKVILANRNSPGQGVLSGPGPEIIEAEELCREKGFIFRRLPVSAAFHTAMMQGADRPFRKIISKIDIAGSGIPVFSNVTADVYPENSEDVKNLLASQILSPVNFSEEIENMYERGARIFLEVGPKNVLTGLIRTILKGKPVQTVSADASSGKGDGCGDLAHALCCLAALGRPVKLDQWELSPEIPARKQRMSIPISGANIRSKKKARVETAAPPKPVLRKSEKTEAGLKTTGRKYLIYEQPVETVKQPPKRARQVSEMPGPFVASKTKVHRKPDIMNDSTPNSSNRIQSSRIQNALGVVKEGLQSIQNLQMQTAETHKKFLDTQAEANRTLQQMMAQTQRLAEAALGGSIPAEDFEPSYMEQQRQRAPVLSEPPDPPQSNAAPPEAPGPARQTASVPAPDAVASEQAVDRRTRPANVYDGRAHGKELFEPAETVPASSRKPISADLEDKLLAVVSDLTGYPEEMLGMDMDIESDLGIDSIKRVEILSTLEEKVQGLPTVSPERMGKMKTLGEVLASLVETDSADDHPDASSSDSGLVSDTAKADRTAETLLAVVGELTGYPVEMLGMDMDIESDLGIDSIKRVEILSSLEERLPDLPQVSPESMGKMKTLGEIVASLSMEVSETSSARSEAECAPEPNSGKNGNGLKKSLLSVVSDLTGYPPEMLDFDMDIESDLGIDSIKRVEILSALEEKTPNLPIVSPEKMGKMKTLGEILDYLAGGHRTSSKKTEVRSEEISDIETDAPRATHEEISFREEAVSINIVSVSEAALPAGGGTFFAPKGKILVAGTDDEMQKALVDKFLENNMEAEFVSLDACPNEDAFSDVSGLVILSNRDVNDEFMLNAFLAAKCFSKHAKGAQNDDVFFFATISFMDGAFGFGDKKIDNPEQGGLAGLAKTADIEWPGVKCRALDIDPGLGDSEKTATAIAEELLLDASNIQTEIGLGDARRVAPVLLSAPEYDGAVNLSPGDAVLATGGARGVTARAVLALAEETSAAMILLGRSPLPESEPSWLRNIDDERAMKKAIVENEFQNGPSTPSAVEKVFKRYASAREIRKNIRKMENAGSAVRYLSADVCDDERIEEVFESIRAEFGPVKAIVHGAGVLEDRLIEDKTAEQFLKVYDAKVKGLRNLLKAAGSDPLRYLVLFSSVAGRFGNKGQVDYAVANEVLNKMARKEAFARPDCRVLSIDWGPWDGGMVSPALRKEFERRNIPLIPLKAGGRCMVDLMRGAPGAPVEFVAGAPISDAAAETGFEEEKPEVSRKAETVESAASKLTLTFKRELDLERHPVLASHRLDGKPVVPLALMTEWLGCGALHENPGLTLQGLDKLHVLNGIKLEGEKKTIRLLAGKARKANGAFEVDVEIRDGFHDGREVIHSRAKAILANDLPEAPEFDKSIFKDTKGYSKKIGDIYDRVLFHGVELQGIKKITSCTPDFMVAEIAPAPPPEKWMADPIRSRWIADPLVLDCAFQMAIVWTFEQKNMVCLPSFSESYRQYRRRFPAGPVTAVFEIKETCDKKIRGNFTFLDENDAVIALLTGYEAVMDPSLYRAFKPDSFRVGMELNTGA